MEPQQGRRRRPRGRDWVWAWIWIVGIVGAVAVLWWLNFGPRAT